MRFYRGAHTSRDRRSWAAPFKNVWIKTLSHTYLNAKSPFSQAVNCLCSWASLGQQEMTLVSCSCNVLTTCVNLKIRSSERACLETWLCEAIPSPPHLMTWKSLFKLPEHLQLGHVSSSNAFTWSVAIGVIAPVIEPKAGTGGTNWSGLRKEF